MIPKMTIRRKLLISVLTASLIPLIIGIIYIKRETEDWLFHNNLEQSKILIDQTATYVDESVLLNMKNIAKFFALNEDLINVDPGINRYLHYDKDTFVPTQTESERRITQLFRSVVETNPDISFISYGTQTGGYIEYPVFKPNGPYDPRIRYWYIHAEENNEVVVSEPYQTKVSKEYVISVDDVVRNKGSLVGVISLTISLENIMEKLSKTTYGETGYIMAVSPKGSIINSPHNKGWVLEPYDSIGLGSFESLQKKNGKTFEGKVNGVESILTVHKSSSNGWIYLAVINKNEVLSYSKSLSGLLFVISFIASIVTVALVIVIANLITKPISNLTHAIKRMSSFDFDSYEQKDIMKYTSWQDEIGEISQTLLGMQNNYLELKSSLNSMDKEIQSIDVEDSAIRRVTLSKDNPLACIAISVNGLLDKVHTYIEYIQERNQEIVEKNDLLTASEEELITQLDEINTQKEKIHFLAEHDVLTNLPNRRSFMEYAELSIGSGLEGAIMLIDMDNFKSINDTMGHIFGDAVLIEVAKRLSELEQENIFVARFGGDEFLILYENIQETMELHKFVDLIFHLFHEPIDIDGNMINVDFSMGISRFPQDSNAFNHIMMDADLALYSVKNAGKNHFAFFDSSMENHLREKNEIKEIVQEALDNNGFKMLYQPKVSLSSKKIVGYEALIRLKHYPISPLKFIHIAEEYGLIIPLGRFVTQAVIEQMAIWQSQGMSLKPVSINFCSLQLYDATYIDFLFSCLAANDIAPELIQIEITEHVFIDNKEYAIRFMNQLREHGVGIALDDFGAEYSSLSFLSSLPVDTLKFDREMNLRLLALEDQSAMVNLIAFIKSLKLQIVAEGIETFEHVIQLRSSGCDVIQGFYFSKPVEADEVPVIDLTVYQFD
jgi:diguanylate cyclase (GGDEF)-like protein